MKKAYLFEIGCYFDGSRGIYIGEEVQSLAKEYGWTGEQLDSEHEFYYEAWDEAESYLNDINNRPYTYFGSNDGDFGLWPILDDEDIPRFADYARMGPTMPEKFTGDAYLVNDHGNVTCGHWVKGNLKKEYWSIV